MKVRLISKAAFPLVVGVASMCLLAACKEPKPETSVPTLALTPALRGFNSCDELETHLRTSLSREMEARIWQAENGWGRVSLDAGGGPEMAESANDAPAGGSGAREEGVDYSGTNNQESGVDESDFVKTDGYYIYVLNGNRLETFGVPEFGELEAKSQFEVEGRPNQLLVDGDRAVVFSSIYSWDLPEGHPLIEVVRDYRSDWGYWYGSTALAKLSVLDLSDREHPRLERELYLEGDFKTGRKVHSTVRMVSYAWIDIPGLVHWLDYPEEYWNLDYEDPRRDELFRETALLTIARNNEVISTVSLSELMPQLYERYADDSFSEHGFTQGDCAEFRTATDGLGRGFTSILTLDLMGDEFTFDADHLVTNYSEVYASLDTLVVAEPANEWWWFWGNEEAEDATNLHRFDISEPDRTIYTGSGRVEGMIRDQFSLSEYEDRVRVATTTGRLNRWWMEENDEPANHVFVLEGDDALEVIGHVGGIAKGEQIWSSRFVGESAYLVTFRNIDPLWTIDLSDPRNPEVKGELEVPGVSTYIHPLGGHLLTIGYGGDENGLDWKTQISLFDVTDFSHPTLASSLSMAPSDEDGWSSAYSEASWEHKAFQYWAPKGLLAIPLSTYRYDSRSNNYRYLSKLVLINVNTEDGLSIYGSVDHSEFFNTGSRHYWSYRDVRRSIFMGDYIYAISDRGITAHHLESMELSVALGMEGSNYTPYWNW